MSENLERNPLSAEFLLAEFNALQERAISLEEIKSGRLNFFLLVAGAIIAGLSSLYGNSTFSSMYLIGVLISSVVLFLIGMLTLKNIVDYSIAIVSLYRRAGRIRRWFVDQDSGLNKYVAFEPTDDRPKIKISSNLLAWRGGEPILMVINMVSASALVGSALSLLHYDIKPWIGMILVVPVVWFFQNLYITRRLNERERLEIQRVNFSSLPEDN